MTEGPNTIVYSIKWKCEETLQVKDMNEPKVAQMNKALFKRFREMRSKGNPIIEPVIIKKVQSFCDETNVTDRGTFLEGWLQNLKKPAPAGHIQMENSSI